MFQIHRQRCLKSAHDHWLQCCDGNFHRRKHYISIRLFQEQKHENTVNCCIMNMVMADFLLTLVYMPRMMSRVFIGLKWVVEGIPGLVLCKIVSLSHEISICVSTLTVVVIASERFLAVAFPLRVVISRKITVVLLCGTWLIALAARSPMFYGVKMIRFQSGGQGCFGFPI